MLNFDILKPIISLVVKTRFQLQGELKSHPTRTVYRGIFRSFFEIAKNEGIASLQKGLAPSLVYQFFMNGTRLGTYNMVRDLVIYEKDKNALVKSVFIALFSGGLAGAVGSPFNLVKTRLQSQSRFNKGTVDISVGYQHKYNSMFDAIKSIYKEHGARGFLKGMKAMVLRVSIGSAVQLSAYDYFKLYLTTEFPEYFKEDLITYILSSFGSGFLVTLAMNPFDVVATRLYNEPTTARGMGVFYNGIGDCFVKIIKIEGVKGLYKGFIPHYLRLAPHTILTFVFLEFLKKFANKFFV